MMVRVRLRLGLCLVATIFILATDSMGQMKWQTDSKVALIMTLIICLQSVCMVMPTVCTLCLP